MGTLLSITSMAAAQDCASVVQSFNRLVDASRWGEAQSGIDALAMDSACAGYVVPAQRRLAASRLAAVQKSMARDGFLADYAELLTEADRPGVLWQAAATLGAVRFDGRHFADAAHAFDRAIEIIKNETLTPNAPSRIEIEGLVDRAAQARLLAANLAQKEGGGFVKTATRGAEIGGVFSPRVRGVVPRAIPMPITFDYRSATLTEIGEQAALELARAIREQQPSRVRLVGHTDERGNTEFNKKLSLARAEAVAVFLRQNNVDVPLETAGVGADEPLKFGGTNGLSQDDVYALNRRVEWRRE
jgi:outer membrane protein OmpA-like peptidoglycan-associated protein